MKNSLFMPETAAYVDEIIDHRYEIQSTLANVTTENAKNEIFANPC